MHCKYWLPTAAVAALACGSSLAQEQARVLSSVPIVQHIETQQPFCEDAVAPARSSGAGAVIGALIGGVAGNALGHGGHRGPRGHRGYGPGYGSNRGVTTAVGAIAGGLIGHSVENAQTGSGYETVRRCSHQTRYHQQTVGYDVTYEYAGRRYTTRMDREPGRWIPVQVQPTGSYHSAGGHGSYRPYEALPSAPNTVYSSSEAGYSSYPGEDRHYYGPSGAYRPAPGVTITETIRY